MTLYWRIFPRNPWLETTLPVARLYSLVGMWLLYSPDSPPVLQWLTPRSLTVPGRLPVEEHLAVARILAGVRLDDISVGVGVGLVGAHDVALVVLVLEPDRVPHLVHGDGVPVERAAVPVGGLVLQALGERAGLRGAVHDVDLVDARAVPPGHGPRRRAVEVLLLDGEPHLVVPVPEPVVLVSERRFEKGEVAGCPVPCGDDPVQRVPGFCAAKPFSAAPQRIWLFLCTILPPPTEHFMYM